MKNLELFKSFSAIIDTLYVREMHVGILNAL